MNTPKLPPLPHWCEAGSPFAEQMQAYAIAAIEAQGVPDDEGDLLTIAYLHGFARGKDAASAPPAPQAKPIDMVLHCPACGMQHIDAPEWEDDPHDIEQGRIMSWRNEPHRSHLCHGCSHVWRPADVPTNGVAAVKTKGKEDSPLVAPQSWPLPGWEVQHPIDPEVSAEMERSDWTPEEALRWYAAGRHYDTVPNGDGTSSARILDTGAVASNALKSLSREYAESKGDVALLEQPAVVQQEPVANIWESFPAYLIDNHEGETISEEGLQRALSEMLADPKYTHPAQQAKPQPLSDEQEPCKYPQCSCVVDLYTMNGCRRLAGIKE